MTDKEALDILNEAATLRMIPDPDIAEAVKRATAALAEKVAGEA